METTDGGIVVFKSLDISRIIHLALVTEIPALLICEIKYGVYMEKKKIQKLNIAPYLTNMKMVDSKMLFFSKLSVYNVLG